MSSEHCYPVLSSDTDDYSEESSFDCSLETRVEGNNVVIDVEFSLFDQVLLQAVNEGRAAYSLILKCSKSSYRKHHIFSERIATIKINGSDIDISGNVEIIPELIAIEDLANYKNENLNREYMDVDILIPQYGRLAIASVQTITVKRRDPFRTPESVIRFDIYDDNNPYLTRVRYDDESDYIAIFLTEDMHEMYNILPKNIKEVFSAVYVIPVIVDVIQRHWIDQKNELEYRWYDILNERLKAAYGFRDVDNAYEAASMIFAGFSEEVLNYVGSEFLIKGEGDRYEHP